MNESTIWLEEAYKRIFKEELLGLERRRSYDSALTIEDVQGLLNGLYIREGNNMDGRGALGDTVLAATIAAYEHYISEWKQELLKD